MDVGLPAAQLTESVPDRVAAPRVPRSARELNRPEGAFGSPPAVPARPCPQKRHINRRGASLCIVIRNGAQRLPYSLANAAAATGLTKSTVLRAIQSGRLTARKDPFGRWQIEPGELHRVYPPVTGLTEAAGTAQRRATANLVTALAEARLRASLAEQALSDAEAMIDGLRADRDAWKEQAQRLAGQRSKPPKRQKQRRGSKKLRGP